MDDVRGDVLGPPHGTTPAAVKENKKLNSYSEADLRLCFCLRRLLVFPCGGSYSDPLKIFGRSYLTSINFKITNYFVSRAYFLVIKLALFILCLTYLREYF